MKTICLLAFLSAISLNSVAQGQAVLMRINDTTVSLAEFQMACSTLAPSDTTALQTRIEAFIDRKLKAQAALTARLDTLPELQASMTCYYDRWVQIGLTDSTRLNQAARQRYEQLKSQSPAGQVLVRHIFRYLPQNISATAFNRAQQQMDSIYQALCQGADFETCLKRFSDDQSTFWVKRLQMPAEFEETVFAQQPGTFSQPFFTPQGIHIVQVLQQKTLPPFENIKDKLIEEEKQASKTGGQPTYINVERLKQVFLFTPNTEGLNELRKKGQTSRPLFTLNGQTYDGKAFALFAAAYPSRLEKQLEGFITKSLLDYGYANMEKLHPEIALHLQIYKDSLLAQAWEQQLQRTPPDDHQLEAYFKAHKSDYQWEQPCFYGVVLHAVSKRKARQARKFLKRLPREEWDDAIRTVFSDTQSEIRAETGIFAPGDNAFVDDLVFKRSKSTPLPGYPRTAVLGKKQKDPASYLEVYEQVVHNYRRATQSEQIEKLRAQSKVEINQEVLKTVNNQ